MILGLFLCTIFITAHIHVWLVPQMTRIGYAMMAEPLSTRLMGHLPHLTWILGAIFPMFGNTAIRISGLPLYVAGRLLIAFAMKANPYYRPVITIPPIIVKDGPYRFLAHPGYLGCALAAVGGWLALPSVIGLGAMAIYLSSILRRVFIENKILK